MESPRIVVRKRIPLTTYSPRPSPKWRPGWLFRANQREWFGESSWWRSHEDRVWVYRECPVPPEEVKTVVQNAEFLSVGLEMMLPVDGWAFRTSDNTYMGSTTPDHLFPKKEDPENIREMTPEEFKEWALEPFYEDGWLPSYPQRSDEDPYRPLSA